MTPQRPTAMRGPIPSSWGPHLQSALRIVAAFLFLMHGSQKLLAVPAAPNGPVPVLSLLGVAGLLELCGGVLVLVGLWVRPIAFLLAGEMAVAYFLRHAPRGPWPIVNHGELAVLFCFIWLYLAAVGAGPWSLDARRERLKGNVSG